MLLFPDEFIGFDSLSVYSASELAGAVFDGKLGRAGTFLVHYKEYLTSGEAEIEITVILIKHIFLFVSIVWIFVLLL